MAANLTEAVLGFCRFLRLNGFGTGFGEALDALKVVEPPLMFQEPALRAGLKGLLCGDHEEWLRFDGLFDAWWHQQGNISRPRENPAQNKRQAMAQLRSLYFSGNQGQRPVEEEIRETSGAETTEALSKVDFAAIPDEQLPELEALARRLGQLLAIRLRRRKSSFRKASQVDLRRTLRQSLHTGGEWIRLRYRRQDQRLPRLVFLLDVSGSMDRYNLFFVRIIHGLSRYFQRTDTYLFNTRLQRVQQSFRQPNVAAVIEELGKIARGWSGGTRIGDCLAEFIRHYGRQGLSKRTVVVILSDGLDTGEPEFLGDQLKTIRRRTRKVVWLNPLLGKEGYQPLARGMQAALPHVDHFLAAHTLDSLMSLDAVL